MADRYEERVIGMVAYAGGQLIGSIDLDQPWRESCAARHFEGRNLNLRGQRLCWGRSFRSLVELRRWFTLHGADRVHVVYATDKLTVAKATEVGPSRFT
jgi:hypothetical protein